MKINRRSNRIRKIEHSLARNKLFIEEFAEWRKRCKNCHQYEISAPSDDWRADTKRFNECKEFANKWGIQMLGWRGLPDGTAEARGLCVGKIIVEPRVNVVKKDVYNSTYLKLREEIRIVEYELRDSEAMLKKSSSSFEMSSLCKKITGFREELKRLRDIVKRNLALNPFFTKGETEISLVPCGGSDVTNRDYRDCLPRLNALKKLYFGNKKRTSLGSGRKSDIETKKEIFEKYRNRVLAIPESKYLGWGRYQRNYPKRIKAERLLAAEYHKSVKTLRNIYHKVKAVNR